MRIIITGGAGFIGSAVARLAIQERNCDVLVVDKLTYAGNIENLRPVMSDGRFSFLQSDICDRVAMTNAMTSFAPDAVLHLAAESHVDRSIDGPADFIQTNVVGTFSMLEAARGYWSELPAERASRFRFIHISTDEVFGALGADGLFTESTPYAPSSPYSASKAGSDHLARAWGHTYGLPTIVTNCSNNYGPYHFPEKLIPLTILNALEGRRLPVYGRGENVRDWLFVEDHAAALLLVAREGVPGETYNIGGRSEQRNISVVEAICDLVDEMAPRPGGSRRNLIEFVTDRPGHDFRYAIDCSRIERELGWTARESFESGLRRTVRWYLDNETWWRPLREKIYSGARLGVV